MSALTFTASAISSVSLVTGAGEATLRGVGTGSIRGTVSSTSSTLINIYSRYQFILTLFQDASLSVAGASVVMVGVIVVMDGTSE